ncbi:MAG: NAD(P)-dependent oxidoreductase [Pseudomonadota bacterium]
MKYFPMFIKVDQHPVLIVGGGEQATQKCRLLLKTSAKIIVAADDLDPELLHLVSERKVTAIPMVEAVHRLRDAVLVFVATGCRGADAGFAYCASSLGRVVNVVDQPALCGAITPSIVDRDPVVVAIGTEGTAPILGRTLKARIEESLEPRLGELAALAGRLRAEVGGRFDARERRSFWRWVFGGAPRAAFARGEQREAIRMIKDAIAGRTRADKSLGRISIVATSTDSADLLTLRAAQRLHNADEVFFDGDVSKDALELIRRDAVRVSLPQPVQNRPANDDKVMHLSEIGDGVLALNERHKDEATLVRVTDSVLAGKSVVRLLGPGRFDRTALQEQFEGLSTLGVDVEFVPWIAESEAQVADRPTPPMLATETRH